MLEKDSVPRNGLENLFIINDKQLKTIIYSRFIKTIIVDEKYWERWPRKLYVLYRNSVRLFCLARDIVRCKLVPNESE